MTSGGEGVKELKRRENKSQSQTWHPIVCLHVNECHLFNKTRRVISSVPQRWLSSNRRRAIVFLWRRRQRHCPSNLARPKGSHPRNLCADLQVALRYITFFFFLLFVRRECWRFNTRDERKKSKTLFHRHTEGLARFAHPRLQQRFLG